MSAILLSLVGFIYCLAGGFILRTAVETRNVPEIVTAVLLIALGVAVLRI